MNDTLQQMLAQLLVAQMVKDTEIAKSFGSLSEVMDIMFGLFLVQQKQLEQLQQKLHQLTDDGR